MAEEIRDIAEQEPEEIRLQIDETRSAITEKLEALEGTFVDTVQSAKDTVQETIDSATQKVEETISTVKETVQETVSSVRESVQETVSTVKETFDLHCRSSAARGRCLAVPWSPASWPVPCSARQGGAGKCRWIVLNHTANRWCVSPNRFIKLRSLTCVPMQSPNRTSRACLTCSMTK